MDKIHSHLFQNIKMSFRVEEIVYKIKVKSQFLQGGKCGLSVFFIFFFEKNISNGFEVQDCIPEVKMLLQTIEEKN